MGNYHPRPIVFRQSLNDFPVQVTLDDKAPSWGLSRWNGGGRANEVCLRFLPADDEGFTLRGDTRRLMYRGHKRSHRFTILGDTAFEYDCILNREPESNVITLRMEGAERFDFFRQPDFLKNPLMAGSYAVYKKETLVGEGTGKLCHIHRPEIIDSRGRRVWGELSVSGNELHITIPEIWLSEVKYPVIVDPTIGTATVGSQTTWEQDPDEWVPLVNEVCIPVNRFLVSETINGLCSANFYVYSSEEPDSAGYPVLYSDNNNTPLTRRSAQESYIDLQVKSGKPAGWRSGTMRSNGSIASGSYIWFGISTEYFWYARFDYGSKYYADDNSGGLLPNTYPLYNANYYSNFKPSMYFTYSSAQNFTRTLTQGVTLLDSRNTAGGYKRSVTQAVRGTGRVTGQGGFYRSIVNSVTNSMALQGSPLLIRRLLQQAGIYNPLQTKTAFTRSVTNTAGINARVDGMVTFFRTLVDLIKNGDSAGNHITRIGHIRDTETVEDDMGHTGEYLRGLFVEAGSIAGTTHKADYHRIQQDTVGSEGVSLRHVVIFLRLVTFSLIRDYLLPRFLRSRDELVLKSAVTRELELDSTIR